MFKGINNALKDVAGISRVASYTAEDITKLPKHVQIKFT